MANMDVCRIMRGRAARQAAADEIKSKPDVMGYVPVVEQVERIKGVARGGGSSYIILDEKASDDDGFYVGVPVCILEGQGAGEVATIEEYEGRSRKAHAHFLLPVGPGSVYEIGHAHGGGMGYKVGEAGYIPIPEIPSGKEKPQNHLYRSV
jgi:hypothetical protein